VVDGTDEVQGGMKIRVADGTTARRHAHRVALRGQARTHRIVGPQGQEKSRASCGLE
jgi:hypothetical protein